LSEQKPVVDTLLLLALPASGKSEVRKYLDGLTPGQCRQEFHTGYTVQLDDFIYVHWMRRIDEEMEKLNQPRLFFKGAERPFIDPLDWGTLIHLLNEDYADLYSRPSEPEKSPAEYLFDRLDAARRAAGGDSKLVRLQAWVRAQLATALNNEAAAMIEAKWDNIPDTMEGKTVVIEFARGGPDNGDMPLPQYFGYRHSLAQLSPEILDSNVAALYIWVTPEESRRKNEERADPDDPGSIFSHEVPLEVMLGDYGCDDIDHLMSLSDRPGTILVEAHGTTRYLPIGRFDNRVDKTTFLRGDVWPADKVEAVHDELKRAMGPLVA